MQSPFFDIIIIGAGPAGTTSALALKDSGLKVAIMDKARFPRDKVCGDAIPGPAFKVMASLSKDLEKAMSGFEKSQNIRASKIAVPNGKFFTINWFSKSYNSKRLDFDYFLFNLVRQKSSTEIFEGVKANLIKIINDRVIIKATDDQKKALRLEGALLIGADGVNGVTAKQLTGFKMDKRHHAAAVRAYYSGVKGVEPETNEFFLFKEYLPGYFWIFPLPSGWSNVGFGMLSENISKGNLSLKKSLDSIIKTHPILKKRFENAERQGAIRGFGLPLGSRFSTLSGERFMLAGDAGSLIDPLQGHGIDKAMLSGKTAAEQALRCFETNRFDGVFMKNYDQNIYRILGKEFRRNYIALKAFTKFPASLNAIAWMAQNPIFKSILKKFT